WGVPPGPLRTSGANGCGGMRRRRSSVAPRLELQHVADGRHGVRRLPTPGAVAAAQANRDRWREPERRHLEERALPADHQTALPRVARLRLDLRQAVWRAV